MKKIIIFVSLLLLTSCTNWHSFIADLNERKVESCIYYEGNAAGYVRIRGVTATGGFKLLDCLGTKGVAN